MNRSWTKQRIAQAALLAALLVPALPVQAEDRPNFIFFLVDDLGYADIGANNPETFYETPHIDRLARQGMRFTQAYAANPVCSPTRFSLLTGRYPTRVRATNFFPGDRSAKFLPAELNSVMPLEEVTLGEALHDAGYRTAFLGKWHLGPSEEFWPERQGFDINLGGYARGAPRGYFSPYQNPRLSDGPKGEYLTDRLADEAVRLVDELSDSPFLIYLSFFSVHTPLQAPPDLVRKYELKKSTLPVQTEFVEEEQVWPTSEPRQVRVVQNHPVYAAMVETTDTAVGRVLARLEERQLSDRTIVCFFSDNGGLSTSEGLPTANLPLRGGKGWLYEGGIREPMIIRWPGVTAPGSVCDEPVISVDFLPTLLEIAGVPLPDGREIDGVSAVPLLRGESSRPDRPLFWHYPHYSNQGGFPGGAIRLGDHKLIERYEDGRVHLYNLDSDPSERNDLGSESADRVRELRDLLHEWYRRVDAQFLRAHPDGPQPWRP